MLAAAFLFLLCCAGSSAESFRTVDARGNQKDYGRRVSSLVLSLQTRSRSGKASGKQMVLMRTDGTDIDLDNIGIETCVRGPGNRFTLLFPDAGTAEKATEALRNNPHVLYAEPDMEVEACDTAAEAELTFTSYGAERMEMRPLASWAGKKGTGIRVAVIDSGIGSHPVLSSRVVPGWDYVDSDDDPTNDENGHGTHVAGIVADCTQGVPVSLYAVRILDASGKGKTSNAANGILEAAEGGIPVINLSFVAPGESALLDDAVTSAVEAGCTVVVSAGNSGRDASAYSPSHLLLPGVIVVGAAAENGDRASYSNYGDCVDCYAYGSGISSCSPGGGYTIRSGTSQAAPHIAAACAMLKILRGGSPAALETRIKSLAEEGDSWIPAFRAEVPERIPCHLTHITIGLGEILSLPVRVLPESCGEEIIWTVSDEAVIRMDAEGNLTAAGTGTALLTRACANFEDAVIQVTVTENAPGRIRLPDSLTVLETEALSGIHGLWLIAGDRLTVIGESAVGSDTVILCGAESPVAEEAEARQWQYIAR